MTPTEAKEATAAQMEMARRIVKAHYPEMPADYRGRRYLIALDAIIETTEADAGTIANLREEIEYLKSRLPARIEPQFKGDDNDGR